MAFSCGFFLTAVQYIMLKHLSGNGSVRKQKKN